MPVIRCISAKIHASENNEQLCVLHRFEISNNKHPLQNIKTLPFSSQDAKPMLTLHMRPRVRAPGSHLPSQLSWSIYVRSFIPSLVSLFKQHNLGPIPLSNRLQLRGSDWVQSLRKIFRSAGTAVARRELCFSKGKEEFKVKA